MNLDSFYSLTDACNKKKVTLMRKKVAKKTLKRTQTWIYWLILVSSYSNKNVYLEKDERQFLILNEMF